MSLILNDTTLLNSCVHDEAEEGQNELEFLNRYLSIIETNKQSSRFVPDDAFLALDMAGFVRGCLSGDGQKPGVSAARLALKLVQPCCRGPMQ